MALLLVVSLAFHLAAPGLVGLMIIALQTAFNGITEEHQIGEAFQEVLPFTAMLVAFFAIVAVIHEQHLFTPVVEFVSTFDPEIQPALFFLANDRAAFLFLLTSVLAPLIRLSYGRMVLLALPYTIVLTIVGFVCV